MALPPLSRAIRRRRRMSSLVCTIVQQRCSLSLTINRRRHRYPPPRKASRRWRMCPGGGRCEGRRRDSPYAWCWRQWRRGFVEGCEVPPGERGSIGGCAMCSLEFYKRARYSYKRSQSTALKSSRKGLFNKVDQPKLWLPSSKMSSSGQDLSGSADIEIGESEIRSTRVCLKDRLDNMRRSRDNQEESQNSPTIFKVPPHLRHDDAATFEPRVISIGPYHRRKVDTVYAFKQTEQLKLWCLDKILEITRDKGSIDEYLQEMRKMEARTRSCYSHPIDVMDSDEFSEMLLLDGCVILGYLLIGLNNLPNLRSHFIHLFSKIKWYWQLITYDLLLLENQIPFFILNKLHEIIKRSRDDLPPLIDVLIHNFFHEIDMLGSLPRTERVPDIRPEQIEATRTTSCLQLPSFLKFRSGKEETLSKVASVVKSPMSITTATDLHDAEMSLTYNEEVKTDKLGSSVRTERVPDHLLDILHSYIRPKQIEATPTTSCLQLPRFFKFRSGNQETQPEVVSVDESLMSIIPTATDLHDAGMALRYNEEARILNLSFKNGVLEIPRLVIDDNTFPLLQNLVAMEQCHSKYENHVTNYVSFTNDLVKNHADVTLLRRKEVIINYLGSDEEVAASFIKLNKNIAFSYDESHIRNIVMGMNLHYRRLKSLMKWKDELVRDYLGSPWKVASVIAAVILLVLTFIQTIYAVRSFKQGPST